MISAKRCSQLDRRGRTYHPRVFEGTEP